MKSYFDGIVERNATLDVNDPGAQARLMKMGKALSSPERIKILRLLRKRSMSVVEIAQTLRLPVSSTSVHIAQLESTGLILSESQPGRRGSMKVCSGCMERVEVLFNSEENLASKLSVTQMPIGCYSDCAVWPTCGLADEVSYIEQCDNPGGFYAPGRVRAQLIWFQKGYVEYRFPNPAQANRPLKSLSFSLELCSEAPGYRNDWPSDVTFFLNGVELLTYTSPGDFGGRRGHVTPDWWPDGSTQYGLLKTVAIRDDAVYLDGSPVRAGLGLDSLCLLEKPYIALRIAILDTALHVGGINLFGEKFGDHPQGIILCAEF